MEDAGRGLTTRGIVISAVLAAKKTAIIGGILEGPLVGAIIGTIFGLYSFFYATIGSLNRGIVAEKKL